MTDQIDHATSWIVLLIGGSSGVGKTSVAREIGLRLGVPWMQADDLRLALERATTPDHMPALHQLVRAEANDQTTAEAMRNHLIEVARVVGHALESVVANHVATNTPLIIEGDAILPALAAQTAFADLHVGCRVRSAFLLESDQQALWRNAAGRDRGFGSFSVVRQQRQIRQSWLYGQWLRDQALRHGLPVIAARPWSSLAARVLAALA